MFSNIFTDITYAETVQRLQQLTESTQRKWGTMTGAQMLRHCRAQIDLVLHPADTVKVYPTMMRFSPVRWLVVYPVPWPKGSKTAPELDVNKKLMDVEDFATEKAELLQALGELYQKTHVDAIHPLFGKMGKQQWGRVVWKHLDHHLRQFGL
ncbi:MAG TPA: DUF1569 domain-containing protein [Phnomibacter sp.]|nr:DUF1569 domain-containing protein [Phnomibacter sp.]